MRLEVRREFWRSLDRCGVSAHSSPLFSGITILSIAQARNSYFPRGSKSSIGRLHGIHERL